MTSACAGPATDESGISCSGTSPAPRDVGRAEHVFVVTIDGLRPELIRAAEAPTLAALVARSAHSPRGRTVRPSKTLPAHVSMVTGLIPERHRVLWNEWEPERGQISALTVFEAASRAGLVSALIAGKRKLRHLGKPNGPDVVDADDRDDVTVMDRALTTLRERRPNLMMIHLPDVDRAGHAGGWLRPAQRRAMGVADAQLGRLLDALEHDGLAATSLLIVTADHGGKGRTHGRSRRADLIVPWLVQGLAVRPRELDPVCVTATATVTAQALGVELVPSPPVPAPAGGTSR